MSETIEFKTQIKNFPFIQSMAVGSDFAQFRPKMFKSPNILWDLLKLLRTFRIFVGIFWDFFWDSKDIC